METQLIEFIPGTGVMIETRNAAPSGHERRVVFEMRAEGDSDSMTIEGYAALFDVRTQLYSWLYEEIAPGAFANALKRSDVRLQINHNPDLVLARQSNGTLEVFEDSKGLFYRGKLQKTSISEHYWTMVKSGTISQSSFLFKVEKHEISDINDLQQLRRIIEFKTIFDVAPATIPAYNETTATARSKKEEETLTSPFSDMDYRRKYILSKL